MKQIRWLPAGLMLLFVLWVMTLPETPEQQLVGTWKVDQGQERTILILESNRRVLWQFRTRSVWGRLLQAEFDLVGRWSLEEKQLLLFSDHGQPLPFGPTLAGVRSDDLSSEFQVITLTENELVLRQPGRTDTAGDAHYTRVPVR
ncbi:MAG: hypothetical protein SH850_10835 [Planctomycetaceae bacterium]|nr:hypothetical protein [Planctomycetaceae bacterium]